MGRNACNGIFTFAFMFLYMNFPVVSEQPSDTVPHKIARVFWLKPSDVDFDQKIVDGISGVMKDAQNFYLEELGKTFRLNNPIVEVVDGDHEANWYETHDGGDGPTWNTTSNLRDELMAKYGVRMWDSRWKVVGYISAPGNGCGPHGWVLLPKHDVDGAAIYPDERARWVGGMVHELGHAFTLPDASSTDGTPMSASFYNYPNCHFNESQKNQMLTDSRNKGFWFDNITSYDRPKKPEIDKNLTLWYTGSDVSVQFDLPNPQPVKIEVFELSGRRLFSVRCDQTKMGENVKVIDGKRLNAGLYLFSLEYNGMVLYSKFIIK